MIEHRTIIDKTLISIFLNDSDKNLIFAPGIPQFITKHHPIIQQAERLKINVFIPDYPGTHDSDGRFSIANATKAISQTIKLVKKGSTIDLYNHSTLNWKTNNIFVLGFSFGALPTLLQQETVKQSILLCPFIKLDFHHKASNNAEYLPETLSFLKRAYPITYRLDNKKLLAELKTITLPNQKNHLTVIWGEQDTSIPFAEIQFLEKNYHCNLIKAPIKHSSIIDDSILNQILK